MGVFSRKARKVAEVTRFDGPGAKKGDECAYFNVYEYEDGSCKTIEFDRAGKHLAEYEGEPEFPADHPREPLADGQPPKSKEAKVEAKAEARK